MSEKKAVVGNAMKVRQFTVCQFEVNPRTGAFIQSLAEIVENLKRYKSFTYWAYAIHDTDDYTQDAIDDMNATLLLEAKQQGIKDEVSIAEYLKNNAWAAVGDRKNKHIHIVVKCDYAIEICKIAKWLGIPEHLIKNIKGKGAFLDCVEYLTHEDEKQQKLGKYRYPDSCIFTSDSFSDWRQQLDARIEVEARYGAGKTAVERFILDVFKYGKTLNECKREMDGNDYINNLTKLQHARGEYLSNAEMPNTRITFYVYGDGGIGKNIMCELLARALCPDIQDITDIMFGVGSDNVGFDGYDGQPVIIWQEMRAADLMSNQGRRTVLVALEPHPRKSDGAINVKYGKTQLIHKYNIINGVDPYDKFLSALAGEYIDKRGVEHHAEQKNLEQFYRRIPIIIPISEDMFRILVNSGVFNGTREFTQYCEYSFMVGSFAKLQQRCGNNKPLMIDISKPLVFPIVDAASRVEEKLDVESSENEIRAFMAENGYGVGVDMNGHSDPRTEQEYQEFLKLWAEVYPEKSIEQAMTLREWILNGRHTHYDRVARRWYRPAYDWEAERDRHEQEQLERDIAEWEANGQQTFDDLGIEDYFNEWQTKNANT